MSKFVGKLGFVTTVDSNGTINEIATEKSCIGDYLKLNHDNRTKDKTIEDTIMQHRISVIRSAYIKAHLFELKYVLIDGHKWEISNIEEQPPRIIIHIGGGIRV